LKTASIFAENNMVLHYFDAVIIKQYSYSEFLFEFSSSNHLIKLNVFPINHN
jgi:hypothetical protein